MTSKKEILNYNISSNLELSCAGCNNQKNGFCDIINEKISLYCTCDKFNIADDDKNDDLFPKNRYTDCTGNFIDFNCYINDAVKTECEYGSGPRERLDGILRILHSTMGISTESGELLDAIKKHVFYGKKLDFINIKEELGDLFWYIAVLCDDLNIDIGGILNKNIEKLKSRYPNRFTEESAINRDLKKEREILEDTLSNSNYYIRDFRGVSK
jgi:NTP pyrophosphatase (non-canonical NTP hydrolase)